jgi:geranylgeranyl pyrophosphate synthase
MKASATIGSVTTGAVVLPPTALSEIEQDRRGIESSLIAAVGQPNTRIDDAARYELQAGGKRVRPLLSCAVLRALGRDPTPFIDYITAVELAHTGSLLHDDILDGATTRRGREAAHLAFDVPTAILAGDSLVVLALERLAGGAPPLLIASLCAAIKNLCAGESLERERLHDASVDLAHCRRVNRLKTASLFGYAAEAGALLAGAEERVLGAARAFGAALGEAFQATDDLLDFRGDSAVMGKPIGRDLVIGMVTVPLAFALERDPALREELRRIWQDERAGKDLLPRLVRLRERMAQVGAFAATRRLAGEETARAVAALDRLPPGRWREHLRSLTQAVMQRRS